MSSNNGVAGTGSNRSRKRLRAARACEPCRAKKYKCDELYPCSQCKKQTSECVYEGAENPHKRLYLCSYVADLEKQVQDLSGTTTLKLADPPTYTDGAEPGHANEPARVPNFPADHGTSSVTGKRRRHVSNPTSGLEVSPGEIHHLSTSGEDEPPSDTEPPQETSSEIMDVNSHTKSVEFHGNTSSMAFLSRVQTQDHAQPEYPRSSQPPLDKQPSLVSTLHNVSFSTESHIPSTLEETALQDGEYYFRQSRIFLDGYFENLHFIHPILGKEEFLTRCEDLWFGRSYKQARSFVALYYSILSLGALVRVWDEDFIEGLDRFQWSKKLFDHARLAVGEVGSTNDLETVQCLIFIAKVCQNRLNPRLAYAYLGMAVRASLSAGHNREPVSKEKAESSSTTSGTISKTWWGLYSLEVEMCFALGRPDTLGLDDYHSRRLPVADDSENAIVPSMVSFARIIRRISVAMYLSKSSLREKISTANQIQEELDSWLAALPDTIRPHLSEDETSFRISKDPKWARRQRLVLHLRYFNVKMVLYRPFLAYASQSLRRLPAAFEATVAKCVDAARETIEVMHDTFRHHVFFRTWWYNTTYTLYAASTILCYIAQAAPSAEKLSLFRLVDMAVEVLQTMDECIVAKKTGEMIGQTLSNFRLQATTTKNATENYRWPSQNWEQPETTTSDTSSNAALDSQMPSIQMDAIFDLDNTNFAMDDSQFLFWSDWNSIGLL